MGISTRKVGFNLMSVTDVYILNVGSGSCVVVTHPSERKTMIDINNGGELRDYELTALREASGEEGLREAARYRAALTNPIEWYRRWMGTDLWRFILSHPDADHMAGVRCLFDGHINTSVFWDLPHTKRPKKRSEYRSEAAYEDALAYHIWRSGRDHPARSSWPKPIHPLRFEADRFWEQDQIEILSPSKELLIDRNEVEDWNNMSYALRINYGGRSVLVPGDVQQTGWNNIATECGDMRMPLNADVLVASHHGRKSGYPDDGVLELIDPAAVIVSVGTIPAKDDALARYRRNVEHVVSTRTRGSLLIRMYASGALAIATGVDTFREQDMKQVLGLGPRRLIA